MIKKQKLHLNCYVAVLFFIIRTEWRRGHPYISHRALRLTQEIEFELQQMKLLLMHLS